MESVVEQEAVDLVFEAESSSMWMTLEGESLRFESQVVPLAGGELAKEAADKAENIKKAKV